MRPFLQSSVLIAMCTGAAFGADPPVPPPPKPTGIIILGATAPTTPAAATKVSVAPGRFVPITAADGAPSYIEDAPGYRVYRVTKGSAYVGIKYDAAADAEPEEYTWDKDVMILLARKAPGTYKIQLVKNGEGMGPPVKNGPPIDLEVQGAIPPPPVIPVSTLAAAVQTAFSTDATPNKAALVTKLANLYRAAGTVTVNDASVKTYFDLFQDVSTANAAQMKAADLQSVRVVIEKYLDGKLPIDKKTAIDRTLAGTEFLNVAAALDAVLPK